jgi:hypothetical protein
MTDEKRREAVLTRIREYTAANTTSAQVARDALIREGIYDSDGKLRREYGGQDMESVAKKST